MALICCPFQVAMGAQGCSIFNIEKCFILCTEYIYAFCMVPTVNELIS